MFILIVPANYDYVVNYISRSRSDTKKSEDKKSGPELYYQLHKNINCMFM